VSRGVVSARGPASHRARRAGQPASLLIADREREGAVRVVVLSDTHNKHDKFEVPDGDILLHCGDFTFHGTQREIRAFNEWLGTLPHRHKFVIAGNHELTLDGAFYEANWSRFHKERDTERPGSDLARQLITNAVYLEHETVSACGLRIYGCPTMPHLPRRMAFGVVRGSDEERAAYAQIPADLDILMTHAPPAGIRDTVILGFGVGSQLLRDAVRRSRPRFHVFGHIHESFGIDDGCSRGRGLSLPLALRPSRSTCAQPRSQAPPSSMRPA
jgi:predicted phosphohydrolase